MSVEAVTEAGEIRRRSILTVLRVTLVFLPIAAFTADNTVEQVAYPVAILPFLAVFLLGRSRRISQTAMESGLLVLGSVLVTVLFGGILQADTTVAALADSATSFGARNSLMLAAGAFLLLGPRRGLLFSCSLLAAWIALTIAAADALGDPGALVGHVPEFVRAFLSTVVTLAVLWALTSQNMVWSSGEAAARQQAERDPLTGLANRRRLLQRLEALLDGPMGQMSLAMVDVDHFKLVNDTHGHDVGDAALRAVARTLHEQVREGDLVARWGGEEFVVVFAGVGPEQAAIAAERCRAAVAAARPRREDDLWFPDVTASFGLTTLVAGDTPADILRRADEQLYRAKDGGRDRVCLDPSPEPTGG